MKSCTACGSEINNNQTFCVNCGNKVEEISHQQDHTSTLISQSINDPNEDQSKQQKKPLSRKNKVIIGSIAGLLIIMFGTYQFLSGYFDPIKDLRKMEEAIVSHDINAFMSFINIEENGLFDEESYFQYIKDHEWDHAKMQYEGILEEDLINKTVFLQPIQSINDEILFKVEKTPVLFGLFHSYQLEAVSSNLTVSTTLDQTKFTFIGEEYELDSDRSVEIATIYPGLYQYVGRSENIFGEFLIEDELMIRPGVDNEEILAFPTDTYLFETDLPDATLFINGRDSGLKLSELNDLGPFPDPDVEIYASWTSPEGEVFTTEKAVLSDNYWGVFYFSFDDLDQYQVTEEVLETETFDADEIGNLILNFRDAYEIAVNEKDFSLIVQYLKDESEAYQELDIYIGDLQDTSYHYDFTENHILDVTEMADGSVVVATRELFTFTNHLNNATDYDREKIYTLENVDGVYEIRLIEYVETNRNKR